MIELKPSEMEVCKIFANYMCTKKTAELKGIAVSSVYSIVYRSKKKLNCKTTQELIAKFRRQDVQIG
jgi:DNA-binding CsgD family transcriptional regulator